MQSGVISDLVDKKRFIVVTRSGSSLEMFVDGVSVDTGTMPAITPTEPLVIGADSNLDSIRFFHGYIDEVAIFDRALTAPEIAEAYEVGLDGFNDTTIDTSTVSEVGFFVAPELIWDKA